MLCTQAWLRGVLQGSAVLLSMEEVSTGSCKPATFPFSTSLPHLARPTGFWNLCWQYPPTQPLCGQNKEAVNKRWDRMQLKEQEVRDHLLSVTWLLLLSSDLWLPMGITAGYNEICFLIEVL